MGKGRKAGSSNYQNEILLEIVADIRPASLKEWRKVAVQYKKDSGEEEERDPKDLRSHFQKKLCSMSKKPTGNVELESSAARCNRIHEDSAAKEGARNLQADTSDSEEEDFVPVERRLFQGHSPPASSRDEVNWVETREHHTSHAFSFPGASPLGSRQSPLKKLSPLRASLLKKRKNEDEEVDNKSKSSRPTNPRTNAAGALSNLATALSTNAAAAQQQQLVQAQANQQAQMMQMQSQMMMSMMSMMTMVMSRAAPAPSPARAPVPDPSLSPKTKE